MKKILVFLSISFILLFAAACGDDAEPVENDDNQADTEEAESDEQEQSEDENEEAAENEESDLEEAKNQDDMKTMMENVDFVEFELEVEYASDKEFEVEIERHHNGDIEAEVEDELNDNFIKDDVEAFNYIFPKIKDLNISRDMDKQDAIDQMLEAFDLADDYEEIEIEFEFLDGKELEFEEER